MNTIQFRKSSKASVIVAFALLLLWTGGFLWSVSLWKDPAQGVVAGFYGLYVLAFLLPVLLFGIKSIRNYRIRYVLTEEALYCYEGSRFIQQIPKSEILAFGCYGVNKNAVLFFVAATEAEISAVAMQDWEARSWSYTRSQLDELEQTPEGIRQIEIALYLQRVKDNGKGKVLTLEFSAKCLRQIAGLWNMAPMYLGSQAYAHRNSPF